MITELPLYNKILVATVDFIGIWLAFFVYKYSGRKKLNKIFILSLVFMFLWVNFAYLARLIGKQQIELSLICLKIAWFATPLLFVSLYFFIVRYLEEEKNYSILNNTVLISGIIVALITSFTNLIVKDIEFSGIDLTIIYGRGMFPFLGIIFFFMCASVYLLAKEYFKRLLEERIRIEYLLVGISIFYLANIIFNITFPIFLKVVYLYWLGDYSAIVLLGFIAYAIVKRELFGIRVILTTVLVSLIAVLFGVDIFAFTPQLNLKLYKGLILIVFLYFGYLLVRSVLREIEYREKIARAYEVEKLARKEIEQLGEAKTQFIMATQHHFRTPLTSMRGYLDLIFGGTYGKVPERLKETLLKFQVSTSRLIRIVNELLDISQFQLGKKVVTLEPGVQLGPILEEVVEELQFETKARGLYLKLEKAKELPAIAADPEKLKVALFNIVDNAIKYTQQGGITVKAVSQDSKARIIVKDTGIGIAPEEAKNLFNRVFERGKQAKEVHGLGRGIGLYITSHIITAHNGKIWAESEGKGKGSSFFIELPISESET